jgi:hypothetical protein
VGLKCFLLTTCAEDIRISCVKRALMEGVAKCGHELAAEDTAEYADGQEEGTGGYVLGPADQADELLNHVDVTANRPWRVVTALQFLKHDLA